MIRTDNEEDFDNIDDLFENPEGLSFEDTPSGQNYANQMNYNTQGQMGYSNQGQMNYNTQGQMGYNTQGQMDYNTQNQMNYNNQGQNDYADNYENQNYNGGYYNKQVQREPKENKGKKIINDLAENGVHLSSAKIGIGLAIVGVIIILILMGISKIPKKPATQKVVTTTTTVTTNKSNSTKSTKSSESNLNNVQMTVVEDNVSIDYSAGIIETTGLVTAKYKYLLNGQLVYSLGISINVGNEQKELQHFCNYNVFKTINTGDVLGVKYQQVANTVVSICDVIK